MEWDFMGLSSKDAGVKKEARGKQPVFLTSSDVGWPFANRLEAVNNHQDSEIQKMRSLLLRHDTKQGAPVTMSSPAFWPHVGGAHANPQLLGRAPVTSHLASTSSVFAPTTEQWYGSKAGSASASAPAQLTIFYKGMVNVYDDISPEKAQSIMSLAGKGAFEAAANAPHSKGKAPMIPAGDVIYMNHPISTQPRSAVSSPVSVSSHPVFPITCGPANENKAAKLMASAGAMSSQWRPSEICFKTRTHSLQTPRLDPSTLRLMSSTAVPQARKASLLRFLEKRKERVMAAVPYNLGRNLVRSASNDAANKQKG